MNKSDNCRPSVPYSRIEKAVLFIVSQPNLALEKSLTSFTLHHLSFPKIRLLTIIDYNYYYRSIELKN